MGDGYSVDSQTGRVQAGEVDTIFWPRTPRTGSRGVVLCHSYSDATVYTDGGGYPNCCRLAAYLASNGIPCIAGQFGNTDTQGDNWGNAQAQSRFAAAVAVLQSAFPSMATDKVCTVGVSMGHSLAALYAINNPTKIAAGYGIIPVCDINDIYTNNRFSLRAAVGTAWGVTYPTALPAEANISAQVAAASAIPWRLDYGGADTTVIPSTVTALATAWGANCVATQTDNSLPHGDGIVGKTDPQTVLSFLTANGC